MGMAKADFIEGMAKGLAVLESFNTERQRLNATQAAQRAGITRAAARRHLLTLAHLGYLESDGSHYWLSPKVLRFSGSYLASARVPRTVQPVLNRLASVCPDAFSVAVLDDDAVVIVARSVSLAAHTGMEGELSAMLRALPSQMPVRLLAHGLHLGARLPAHATSTGRVLLAAKSDADLSVWLGEHALPRLTGHTETDPQGLRLVLEDVRRQDHALASETHELGVHAVAVPRRDTRGQTVAALNAVLSAERLSRGAVAREILPALQDAARELRTAL